MKYALGLILFFTNIIFSTEFEFIGMHKNSGLKLVSYESLPFDKLYRTKRSDYYGYERTVYGTKDHDYYLKVWAPDFQDTAHFLYALDVGIYKDITSLVYLIVDKNKNCRGYVCKYIQSSRGRMARIKSKYGYEGLKEVRHQPKSFQNLYRTLVDRMKKNNLIYHDISKDNFLFANDRCYLVDLDAICFTHELLTHPRINHIIESNPKDHSQLILEMAQNYFSS